LEADDDRLKLCDSLSKAHTNLLANSGPSVVDPRAVRANLPGQRALLRPSDQSGLPRKCANQVP
jgi:hypothetical protein